MRLLYIVSKGTSDPTLASVPLHIAANGSLEVGQDVSVVLVGGGHGPGCRRQRANGGGRRGASRTRAV
jgi:hypothetical protein